MKLGTHVPDGERRKPIDNEVCRTKLKVTTSKNRTTWRVCTKFHLDQTFHSEDIVRKRLRRPDAIHHIISRVRLGCNSAKNCNKHILLQEEHKIFKISKNPLI
jgi:hypothetical protein